MSDHELYDFMRSVSDQINNDYARIRKRSAEDPGTAGDEGEESWATVLRKWLPPNFQVVTKGRILSHEGKDSPQVDILVLHPTYPQGLRDNRYKYYLAGGVVAAFECKLTLDARGIKQAMKNAVKIRSLTHEIRVGSPYDELYSPIMYGLLAHSHSWKGDPRLSVEKNLNKLDHELIKHPREMLDVVCVADLATWIAHKLPHIGFIPQMGENMGVAATGYMFQFPMHEGYTPIGTAIFQILYRMAWEYPEIRRFAHYVRLTDSNTAGSAGYRIWKVSDNIYSEGLMKVLNDIPQFNEEDSLRFSGDLWNKWRPTLP